MESVRSRLKKDAELIMQRAAMTNTGKASRDEGAAMQRRGVA